FRFENTRELNRHLHDRQCHIRVHVLAVLANVGVSILRIHSAKKLTHLAAPKRANDIAWISLLQFDLATHPFRLFPSLLDGEATLVKGWRQARRRKPQTPRR